MKNSKLKVKALASKILKCGSNRIRVVEVSSESRTELRQSTSREDVRELIKKGYVFKRPSKTKKSKLVLRSRKRGTKNARGQIKKTRKKMVKKMRSLLKQYKPVISRSSFWEIYGKIKQRKILKKKKLYQELNEKITN